MSKSPPPSLVGEVWPAALPAAADPEIYGTLTMDPVGPCETRSYQTFRLVYRCGRFGLDDTGAIRIAMRMMSDAGRLQAEDPAAPNYASARCSGQGRIALDFETEGGARPWRRTLTATLHGGYLKPGDEIEILLGDTSAGSPGFLMQTFAESGMQFRGLADVCATGQFLPLADPPEIAIVAGPGIRWRAVLPSLRRPGEPFRLGLKCEDVWGNPSAQVEAELALRPSAPVEGLPERVRFERGRRSVILDGLVARAPGTIRVAVEIDGREVAEAGPLVIREGAMAGYWADLHAQSGETVGVGSAREHFAFGRDLAFLDAVSHQGNDFQINDAFWAELNRLTAEFDEPGRLVALPGYEWSGNTGVGGDRNVFFRQEGRAIRRSHRALLTDRAGLEGDVNTVDRLFAALDGEDCVVFAHVGGRYADISLAHAPRLETAVEIHSDWGAFEWILEDAFRLGRRVGVVCNSDGHKGRPGASYPGASQFGAYGGLTCYLADRLDRDALFAAMRARRHYGATGPRLHLAVEARFASGARRFERDPAAWPDAAAEPVEAALMGDIVAVRDRVATVAVEVVAHAPIDRVEFRRGAETVAVRRPFAAADLGRRIRVLCEGAEYRGRGRETLWSCRAQLHGARIARLTPINHWNPEREMRRVGSDQVVWKAVTTGNAVGFEAALEGDGPAAIGIASNLGDLRVDIDALGLEPQALDCGGLGRRLSVARLPDRNPIREMRVEVEVDLLETGDTPLWTVVTTEDGAQAFSSPIYVLPRQQAPSPRDG